MGAGGGGAAAQRRHRRRGRRRGGGRLKRLGAALGPGFLSRFGFAAAAGAAAHFLALLASAGPGHLSLSVAVAFAAGALLGPAGVAGVAVARLLPLALIPGHPPLPILLAAGADALTAAVAWLCFRLARGPGRGLPDLASYLFVLAAILVSVVAAAPALAVAVAGRGDFLPALGLRLAGGLSGAVLVGLPLLVCGRNCLSRWAAEIPGERPASPVVRLQDEPDTPSVTVEDADATLVVPAPRSQAGAGVALGAAMIVLITVAAAPLTLLLPQAGDWAALLYLVPVIWGARTYGLRGGVVAASLSGLAFLVGLWLAHLAGGTALAGPTDPHPLYLYAQLLLLSPVGAYLGQAREREVRLHREVVTHARLLRQDLLRVVRALSAAIEAKDSYTEGHLRRVGEYAVAVAARLGMRGRDLELLYYAAMLHDVGKIGVPEHVLRKRGPLDEEEAALMRRHPEIGARIVRGLDLLSDAAPLILHHQERWDGGDGDGYPGYPAGLRGEQIPLGARIIAVVDTYDAITSHRPYRAAASRLKAVEELRSESGRQFDPRVVEAFLEVLDERPWE